MRGNRWTALAAIAAIVGAALMVPTTAAAAQVEDGLSASSAAASCWAIKQNHPASTDGVYWLQTPKLQAPEQFYCDMTTDGGGWILVGRGRQGWSFDERGTGTASQVRNTPTGTSAFTPAALPQTTIDGLLDGTAVKDLDDGVLLRRAANTTGTSWQNMELHFLDLQGWAWSMGAGHRLASVDIDGTSYAGCNTKDFQQSMAGQIPCALSANNDDKRLFTYAWSSHGGKAGFSYGSSVTGSTSATSYLWMNSTENHAIPFTQVFIRPKTMSYTYDAIADAGLPASTQSPMVNRLAEPLSGWGVTGAQIPTNTEPTVRSPVLAFAEWGDTLFVGGRFADVRQGSSGTPQAQQWLAAFDKHTGAWISSFRPVLDGPVWDLATTADGKLIVGGEFTNINGAAGTSALAALDPATGNVRTDWRASVGVTNTTRRPMVQTVDVDGNWVYAGGNFNRMTGLDGVTRNMGRVAKVSAATGQINGWRPNVSSQVTDLDATATRVYIAGPFKQVNSTSANSSAVIDASTGQLVPGMAQYQPTASASNRQYQQAIMEVGDSVWLGGSEHNTQAYSTTNFSLQRSFVTANNGGDTQALAEIGGIVYQGSHGNAWIYEDATAWPNLTGYTRANQYQWAGAFDATTKQYIREWVPDLKKATYNWGVWELFGDSDECLWAGGDLTQVRNTSGANQWMGGFAKFCPRDATAPTTPTGATATLVSGGGIQLNWDAATDASGTVTYEVLRNDRVIRTGLYSRNHTDPTGTSADRYFVRAMDSSSNRSATTSVLAPSDPQAPTVPGNVTATVTGPGAVTVAWDASTDNIGVAGYLVKNNGVQVADTTDTSVVVSGLTSGTYSFQLAAYDGAGNQSSFTAGTAVTVDVTAPSIPTGGTAAAVDATTAQLSWNASTDAGSGVAGYVISQSGVDLMTVTDTNATVTGLPSTGTWYFQIQAFDNAGNYSARTSSIIVDRNKPTVPTGLAGSQTGPGELTLSWTPSTDNVGVAGYIVYRNGTQIGTTPIASYVATGLPVGNNYIAVAAYDAAGNTTVKSPSINFPIV
jgi:hypothetical protein